MMQVDISFVRSSRIYSLCGESKDVRLVCCWVCYGEWRMRDGNEEAEALISKADAKSQRASPNET